MMTFTYILLWILIGIYACGIIYNYKLKKDYEKLKVMADGRQRSADELYKKALKVITKDKLKNVAYDKILDAAESAYRKRHGVLYLDEININKDFYKEVESILLETQEELNK